MSCVAPLDGIKFSTRIKVVFRRVKTKSISKPLAEMAINILIIIWMHRGQSKRISAFSHNHSS